MRRTGLVTLILLATASGCGSGSDVEQHVRDRYEQRFAKLAVENDLDKPAEVKSVECDDAKVAVCTVHVSGDATDLELRVRVARANGEYVMSEVGSKVVDP